MRIAVIAWGSLIWNPGNLQITGPWRNNGPLLPVEFARISRDGRVTLVIFEGAQPQRTYWARSSFDNIQACRNNLAKREGTCPDYIHGLDVNGQLYGKPSPIAVKAVKTWLEAHTHELDAAVWTGLPSNWEEKRGRPFSPEDVVQYLRDLDNERRQRAREYFQKAPQQIQTAVRQRIAQCFGW